MPGDILFIADAHNSDFGGGRQSAAQNLVDRMRSHTGNFWVEGQGRYKDLAKNVYYQDYDAYGSNIQLTQTDFVSENWDGGCTEGFQLRVFPQQQQSTNQALRPWLDWFAEQENMQAKYRDHCTIVSLYEKRSNKEEEYSGVSNLYSKVNYEYNFYKGNYESKIEDENISEVDLPNFYNLFFRLNSIIYKQGGLIPIPEGVDIPFTPNNKYFDDWTENYDDWRRTQNYNTTRSYFERVGFSKQKVFSMNDLFLSKELFPMCATVEFTADPKSEIGELIEKTRFSRNLMQMVEQSQAVVHRTTEVRVDQAITGESLSMETHIGVSRKYYDVERFFAEFELEELPQTAYFGEDANWNLENRAYYNLMAMIVQGKIQKIKKERYRKFSDILAGETAYSEPVIYELEKRDENGQLIQKFVFANTIETDLIKFVDTQIKYNKKYTYSLHSWSVVIGTKYSYTVQDTEGTVINFLVNSKPNVLMMRSKLMEDEISVLDSPPVNPDVEIIPIVGQNNKVRIHLNSPPGKFSQIPILFNDGEQEMIDRIRQSQKIPEDVPEITFDSDDNIDRFLIYRTDFLPSNYRQFDIYGKKMQVSTSSGIITSLTGADTRGTAGSIIDNVSPNKKYYYCFRSVDVHQNYSYPSDIYKLEIVDDQGSIYPIIEVCQIEQPINYQETKSFKRFMSVSPSISNLIPNDELLGINWSDPDSGPELGDSVVLGINEKSCWSKKFKIRLKSKTSGRSVDFNFQFNQRKKI